MLPIARASGMPRQLLSLVCRCRSCWQLTSVFCAGRRCQQIVSSFRVASSVCIWSVWCAVSSRVESGAFSARWTSFQWPVLYISRRFLDYTSNSTNLFQTPSTSHRCRHHLSFSPLLPHRRMDWSPVHPDSSGSSSSWTFQWLCLSYSRTFRVEDHPLPKTSCPKCLRNSGAVTTMSPLEMSDACAPCAALWCLF